jgi:F-type H+-transporting ATPase subunit b
MTPTWHEVPALVTVAAGDAHPLIDIDWTILIQFALFLVMLLVANTLLFQPYLRLRARRAEGIEGARAEAERMTAEAEAKLVEYEAQLAAARSRASDEQRKIRADANAHEREVTGAARASAVAAIEEARDRVRAQTEAARAELLPRAEAVGRDMAQRLLGREVA